MQMLAFVSRALELSSSATAVTTPQITSRSQRGSTAPTDPLTGREREVAALIAQGMTNRQIAAVLVISETTAEVHVKHVLGKLGFRSRSQVAAWATERLSSVQRTPGQ